MLSSLEHGSPVEHCHPGPCYSVPGPFPSRVGTSSGKEHRTESLEVGVATALPQTQWQPGPVLCPHWAFVSLMTEGQVEGWGLVKPEKEEMALVGFCLYNIS